MNVRGTSTHHRMFARLASGPIAALALTLCVGFSAVPVGSAGQEPVIDSNGALKLLKEGNQRFKDFKLEHPNLDRKRRDYLANENVKQKPFAVIFACTDSRVPPELVFDRGLGDLFIIRTAGQVLDSAALGTIEYGVAYLGAPLIVVLGHKGCGAVSATIEATKEPGSAAEGYQASLVNGIRPAVERARRRGGRPDQLLENAVRENIALGVEQLKTSKVLADAVRRDKDKLRIVGAYYDLSSGAVDFTVP